TLSAMDARGAPATLHIAGRPDATTVSVTETVVNNALALTNPLSGTTISGSSVPVTVAVSPLLTGVQAASFYLSPLPGAVQGTSAGLARVGPGGQIVGTLNPFGVSGPCYLRVSLTVPDLSGGSGDTYYETAGILNVAVPLAFTILPFSLPNP